MVYHVSGSRTVPGHKMAHELKSSPWSPFRLARMIPTGLTESESHWSLFGNTVCGISSEGDKRDSKHGFGRL